MANLKEIRSRITSVKSTMQITSAMKMVSAAKLKKAQDAILQMRPYSNKLTEILENLTNNLDSTDFGVLTKKREPKKILLVSITSNRGLCGGFNMNVIKKAQSFFQKEEYKNSSIKLLSIGKKSSEFFLKTNKETISTHDEIFSNISFEETAKIAEKIIIQYQKLEFDKVVLIYNQFKNAATQYVVQENYLPIEPTKENQKKKENDYIFEPEKSKIIRELIPRALKTQLYKALLDSYASEHGARMTAMHKATDNASDLKDELTLSYNKARQAAITGEILEIVGGAEALNN